MTIAEARARLQAALREAQEAERRAAQRPLPPRPTPWGRVAYWAGQQDALQKALAMLREVKDGV